MAIWVARLFLGFGTPQHGSVLSVSLQNPPPLPSSKKQNRYPQKRRPYGSSKVSKYDVSNRVWTSKIGGSPFIFHFKPPPNRAPPKKRAKDMPQQGARKKTLGPGLPFGFPSTRLGPSKGSGEWNPRICDTERAENPKDSVEKSQTTGRKTPKPQVFRICSGGEPQKYPQWLEKPRVIRSTVLGKQRVDRQSDGESDGPFRPNDGRREILPWRSGQIRIHKPESMNRMRNLPQVLVDKLETS